MSGANTSGGGPAVPPQPPITISGTGALVPLLGVAGTTVAAVVGFMENQPPFVPNEGVVAAVPHSPSEFPAVFAHDEALDGLDAGLPDGGLVPTAMPPLSDGVFPRMDCHGEPDQPPNPQRRKLEDAHSGHVHEATPPAAAPNPTA